METIIENPGLIHIFEQILDYLDIDTIKQCHKVSRVWNEQSRIFCIKIIKQLWYNNPYLDTNLSDTFPNYNEVIECLIENESTENLCEVASTLQLYFTLDLFMIWSGETPLHIAARAGNIQCLEALLNTGLVEINEVDRKGKSILFNMCEMKQKLCTKEKLMDCFSYLLDNSEACNLDLDTRPGYRGCPLPMFYSGDTLFMKVCDSGDPDVIRLFLEHPFSSKIDFNAVNSYGATAFIQQCMIAGMVSKSMKIVNILMEYSEKLDLKSKDRYGYSGLMYARDAARNAVLK